MKRRLLLVPLLVTALGWIWFCSFTGLGVQPSSHLRDTVTGDSGWRLLVYGSSGQSLSLTFDELVAMPRSTVYVQLHCYGALVDSGNWAGVRLGLLLEKAGLSQEANTVEFRAEDGYTIRLTLSTALREDVIVAYEKDGIPLLEKTRLVIPSANGSEWISRITQVIIIAT